MSMVPFLEHAMKCSQCRNTPRELCAVGWDLWDRGATRLERLIDPRRAKA